MVTDAFHAKGYKPMMVSGAMLHSLRPGTGSTCARRARAPELDPLGRREAAEARAQGNGRSAWPAEGRANQRRGEPDATDREASE